MTLLLRCLAILLVCAAFSRPYWAASRLGAGRAVVVAVDNSFSMQTAGRWDEMRAWAMGTIDHLGAGDQAGVLIMNPAPRWLVPLTGDVDRARKALAGLQPGYETTHYDAALRLAGDALARSGSSTRAIAWMGDEQRLGWAGVDFSQPLPDGVSLLLPAVPAPPGRQAAIATARWELSGAEPALRIGIAQFVPDNDTRVLTVRQGGRELARTSVTLDSGSVNNVLVPLPGVRDGEGLKVEMDADDLPVDDTFYAVRDPDGAKARVLVAPQEGGTGAFDYLSNAIDATRKMASAPLKAEELPDSDWPVNAVVIARGARPFESPLVDRLNRFLKAGGTAWILLNGDPAQAEWMRHWRVDVRPAPPGSVDGLLHLRNWSTDHPVLEPLASNLAALLGIEFYHGYSLAGIDATPIATWEDGGYALAEINEDGCHFLVSGFDLDRATTDWPLKASFVPFVHSTVLWLGQQRSASGDWRVGQPITLPGEGSFEALDTPRPQAPMKASGTVQPEMPGVYRFSWGSQRLLYAVNVRAEESDLSPWATPKDFLGLTSRSRRTAVASLPTVSLSAEEAEGRQRAWWWLLALAAVLLLAELRLSNRTST
jgi:hypothetical protein